MEFTQTFLKAASASAIIYAVVYSSIWICASWQFRYVTYYFMRAKFSGPQERSSWIDKMKNALANT